MKRIDRVRYEMLLRVRDFWNVHRALFPESSAGGQAFASVAQAVAGIDAHLTSKALAAKEGRRAKAAARAALTRIMRRIVRTGRGLKRTLPDQENNLEMPTRSSDVALLAAARLFIGEVEANRDRLVYLGLPPDVTTSLRDATDAFERAMRGRRTGRSDLAAAKAGFTSALALGLDAVRTLDIVVVNALEQDPVLLAKWERDRRVVGGRSRAEPKPALGPPALPAVAPEGSTSETSDAPSAAAEKPAPDEGPDDLLRRAS
ncbi:MAG: hypothetical protein IT184_18040 [Acidobacteria bacterium]|nr:hypothetical protein [Acidobacteriota bacterium]